MWLYRTSGNAKEQILVYEYTQTRKKEHAVNFLKDFNGYLHTDGYQAYHSIAGNITVVGCLAHLRRKFCEALKVIPKDKQKDSPAEQGLRYCNMLFKLERDFADCDSNTRYEKRISLSAPIFEEFYKWLESISPTPKSLLGTAKGYALSQRRYLENYLKDGD